MSDVKKLRVVTAKQIMDDFEKVYGEKAAGALAHNPIPEDIRHSDLMIIAWRDCLMWAQGEPEIRATFEAETGMKLPSDSASPIERMVDKATGYDAAWANAFIAWFNKNVWGPVDGPEESGS
jgi:hypothetical protein